MKKYILSIFFFLLFSLSIFSQTLSKGAAFYFKGVKSVLTVEEKNRVFKVSGGETLVDTINQRFKLDSIFMVNSKYIGAPLTISTTDLNSDGSEDIFVPTGAKYIANDSYTAPYVAYSILMKDKAGHYVINTTLPYGVPYIMETRTDGYKDIVIVTFEYEQYKWNGKEYVKDKFLTTAEFPYPNVNGLDLGYNSEAYANDLVLSQTIAKLFKGIKTTLNATEKKQIFVLSKLTLAMDSTEGPYEIEAYPLQAVHIYPVDLNKDGKEEIIITYESKYYFNKATIGFDIFYKDGTGNYVKNSGIMTGKPGFLSSKTKGYIDIVANESDKGISFYSWDGKRYSITKGPNGEDITATGIEFYSGDYTKDLK